MNTESHDSLDRLLGDWDASRQADEEHLRGLADRILVALRQPPDITDADVKVEVRRNKAAQFRHKLDGTTLPSRRTPVLRPAADWGNHLMFSGGGLLLLLILVGCLLWYNLAIVPSTVAPKARPLAVASGTLPAAIDAVDEQPATAIVGEDLLAAKRRLLAETNALFDNQLAWIADSPREVALEVHDQPVRASDDFVLVRVVVARRAAPDAPWSTIWQTDVISRNETLVEVSPHQLDGSSLELWTYAMPGGEVAVEMDLRLEDESRMHASSSTVVRAGRPARVGCSTEQGGEQCVFQTVIPLDPSQI